LNRAKSSRRSFLNIGAGAAAALGLRELLSPVALSATSPNRAVVCIYLVGGNDSNNMIVPLDSPAYDAYARGRGALALVKDSLLAVQSGPSARYGFHPSLPGLRDLYNQNALAVVANVGRVAPNRKVSLDLTDHLAEMQVRYLPGGYLSIPWAVPASTDTPLQALALTHGVSLAAPGANPVRHRGLVQAVASAAHHDELPDTKLGQQMSTVLSALKAGGFNQQAFLVPLAGFETTQDQLTRQAALFAELDGALVAFHRAISKLGFAEGVTVYTDTEFNRTLVPNKSGGTDHAWGGHQLVLGGSTLGGQIYGRFPSLEVSGTDDAAGNGTWVPSTSSAQYAATLAYWYGKTTLADVPEYAGSADAMNNRLGFLAH
jgi:uncharacterized protein (DUF1501 family)